MSFKVPNAPDATYTPQASIDSGDLSALAGQRIGVAGGCDVVAQATPNMTVIAKSGVVRFPSGKQQFCPGNVTLTIGAASSNPRHDLITAVEGLDIASYAVVQGTAAAVTSTSEPVFPAVPAGRVMVAAVYVPNGVTAITNGMITGRQVRVPNGWHDGTAPRVPWLWPFVEDSTWNLPIATTATFERATDPATASFIATSTSAGTINAWCTYQDYDMPYSKASYSDPLATVTAGSDTFVYRIPTNATIATGSDGAMGVITPDGRFLHDTWQTVRVDSTHYTCVKHTKSDLFGRGNGPNAGIHASGQSEAGGTIREWEVYGGPEGYGEIRHALGVSLDASQFYYGGGTYGYDSFGRATPYTIGYVWPATEQDYDSASIYTGSCPMGSLAAIPPWVDLTTLGLTAAGLVVGRAMQNYGIYTVDRSTVTWGIGCDNSVSTFRYTDWLQPLLNSGDLGRLRAQCRIVKNNTRYTPGGGVWTGDARNRVAPIAPPLPPMPPVRPT